MKYLQLVFNSNLWASINGSISSLWIICTVHVCVHFPESSFSKHVMPLQRRPPTQTTALKCVRKRSTYTHSWISGQIRLVLVTLGLCWPDGHSLGECVRTKAFPKCSQRVCAVEEEGATVNMMCRNKSDLHTGVLENRLQVGVNSRWCALKSKGTVAVHQTS